MSFDLYSGLCNKSDEEALKDVKEFIERNPASLNSFWEDNVMEGTLLHFSCLFDKPKVVSFLLSQNADVTLTFVDSVLRWESNNGLTAKEIAEKRGHKNIVALFEQYERAQVSRKAAEQITRETSAHLAAEKNVYKNKAAEKVSEEKAAAEKKVDAEKKEYTELITILEATVREKDYKITQLEYENEILRDELKKYTNLSMKGEPTGLITTKEFNKLQIDVDDLTTFKKEDINQPNILLEEELVGNSEKYSLYPLDETFVKINKESTYAIYESRQVNDEKPLKEGGYVDENDLLAVRMYTMEQPRIYGVVNDFIRKSLSKDKEQRIEFKKKVHDWKSYIYHLQCATINLVGPKENINVYRGQSFIPEDISLLKPGDEVLWPAFTSCSKKKETSMGFAHGNILFEIQLQPNQGAFFEPYSAVKGEDEILLPAFCKFKIIAISSIPKSIKYFIQMGCLYIDEKNFTKKSGQQNILDTEGTVHSISPEELTIQETIGKGGYGRVCKGNLTVAIKEVPAADKDEFKHEISILSKLKSPFIISLFGVCKMGNNYCIVMEYLHTDLHNYLIKQKSIPIQNHIEIGLDIANGLNYLHQNGIIHSDLKSPNILLTADKNHAKICDFGVSKLKSLTSKTIAGPNSAGTLRWMAPELLLIAGSKSSKFSDIYSFAMILWELFSLQHPFPNCTIDAQIITILKKKKKGNELPLPIPNNTPNSIAEVIKLCWNWEPSARPTMGAVVQKLQFKK